MTDESLVRARVIIHGKVQGVGFRIAARDMARQIHVQGWVRNNPDGTVEAVLEGNNPAVRRVISWCYSGPTAAQVDRVDVQWEEPTKREGTFSIDY